MLVERELPGIAVADISGAGETAIRLAVAAFGAGLVSEQSEILGGLGGHYVGEAQVLPAIGIGHGLGDLLARIDALHLLEDEHHFLGEMSARFVDSRKPEALLDLQQFVL